MREGLVDPCQRSLEIGGLDGEDPPPWPVEAVLLEVLGHGIAMEDLADLLPVGEHEIGPHAHHGGVRLELNPHVDGMLSGGERLGHSRQPSKVSSTPAGRQNHVLVVPLPRDDDGTRHEVAEARVEVESRAEDGLALPRPLPQSPTKARKASTDWKRRSIMDSLTSASPCGSG